MTKKILLNLLLIIVISIIYLGIAAILYIITFFLLAVGGILFYGRVIYENDSIYIFIVFLEVLLINSGFYIGYFTTKMIPENKRFLLFMTIFCNTICLLLYSYSYIILFIFPLLILLSYLAGVLLMQKILKKIVRAVLFMFFQLTILPVFSSVLSLILFPLNFYKTLYIIISGLVYMIFEVIFGVYTERKCSKKEKLGIILVDIIFILLVGIPYLVNFKKISLFFSKIFTAPIILYAKTFFPNGNLKNLTLLWFFMQISFLGGILLSNIVKSVFKKIYR